AMGIDGQGDILICWESYRDGKTVIMKITSKDGGLSWSGEEQISSVKNSVVHPRVISLENAFRVFFVEESVSGKKLNSVKVSVE
ncbi:MAG: hypothetical protein HRT88_11450, partial [Lentisphaeraceae bacterium]|nr:hypothetical protein [Lentisphaeraceae bacterium]